MEASSITGASHPLHLNSNKPSSSFNKPTYVSSHRFLPGVNKTVTLRRFYAHSHRTAAAPPNYFTTKISEDKCVFPLDKSFLQRPLLDQCTRFSCFHHGRRKRFPICKSTPGVFSDKSVFHSSKHGVDNVFVSSLVLVITSVHETFFGMFLLLGRIQRELPKL